MIIAKWKKRAKDQRVLLQELNKKIQGKEKTIKELQMQLRDVSYSSTIGYTSIFVSK